MAKTESVRTVLIAAAVNLAIALAKTAAAVLSGSASMVAEAAHSWADAGNQGLLMIANRRSRRPPDAERPLGYGRIYGSQGTAGDVTRHIMVTEGNYERMELSSSDHAREFGRALIAAADEWDQMATYDPTHTLP